MSTYQTEEEQVEAIKKWWKENGKSVIGGVVLGLAVVGGGKGWIEYQRIQAENASARYEDFMVAAQTGKLEEAVRKGEDLLAASAGSTYAVFTALELARLQYQAGDKAQARAQLQWVVDHADDTALRQMARVRLARLLLDAGQHDEAAQLVETIEEDAWQGEFLGIRGELKRIAGDREAARTDFAQALEKGVSNPVLLRMKLTELGG